MTAKNPIRAYFNMRARLRQRDAQLLRLARAVMHDFPAATEFFCNHCRARLDAEQEGFKHKPDCPVAEAEMIIEFAENKERAKRYGQHE